MKKYVTFVKDAEESRKVQEALFKAGFRWACGSKTDEVVFTYGAPEFLEVNNHGSNNITRVTGNSFAIYQDYLPVITLINAKDIISNPFQLDGAKQPEKQITIKGKEYSESTIHAALQEYVS